MGPETSKNYGRIQKQNSLALQETINSHYRIFIRKSHNNLEAIVLCVIIAKSSIRSETNVLK